MGNRKEAVFEMFVLTLSVVAFSYLIGMSNPVSAQSQSSGVSCCSQRSDGAICQSLPSNECSTKCSGNCVPGSCEQTTFCATGCCIDNSKGTCEPRTPKDACISNGGMWDSDSQCQIAQCKKGCCVLGTNTKFVNENECKTLSDQKGFEMDFNPGITTEIECIAKSYSIEKGACIIGTGNNKQCRFVSGKECNELSGNTFRPGLLCTAPSLGGICKPTKETKCIEDKDEVYFKDSCDNRANIYDASKVDNEDYWTNVYTTKESCVANPDSKTCGSCDRFAGTTGTRCLQGKAEYGNLICKDLSCVDENGKKRGNSESWCVYDGSIGNGEDIVGSRHWLRSCVDGSVKTEGCDDFRTQICVQKDTKSSDGETRSSAACRINRASQCIAYNNEINEDKSNEEKIMENCEKNSDCHVVKVDVAKGFNFNFCAPQYPVGLDQRTDGGQIDAETLCGYANQKCTVIYEKKFTGWKCVQNCDCEDKGFTEKMNNLCTSLGDCGFKINIAGDTDDAYFVTKAPRLNDDEYVGSTIPDKTPADPGQLSEFLPSFIGDTFDQAKYDEALLQFAGISGITGSLIGVGLLFGGYVTLGGVFTANAGPTAVAFGAAANVLVGAAVGAVIGLVVSKAFGLQGDAVLVTTITGAVSGAAAGAVYAGAFGEEAAAFSFAEFLPILGPLISLLIVVVVIIIIVAVIVLAIGLGKTKERVVEFTCQPWQAPTGGDKCKLCGNENGQSDFKVCSKYRCESLGQSCEFINEGTGREACINSNPDDVSAPQIKPYKAIFPLGYSYESVSDKGFSIKKNGGCIDTFDPIIFGITTNERAQCKIDFEAGKEFKDMLPFGDSRVYKQNHFMNLFMPSTESIINDYFGGLDECTADGQDNCLTKDDIAKIKELEIKLKSTLANTNLYVKCKDSRGNKNPTDFVIRTCVNPEPDETAPRIVATEPINNGFVMFNATEQKVKIFTNEPADCRLSKTEGISYEQMKDNFVCKTELTSIGLRGYECSATLPIVKGDNNFYLRCKDKPFEKNESKRFANSEDYTYILTTSQSALEITKLKPDSNVLDGRIPAQIKLEVETKGGAEDGKAVCEWTFGGNVRDFFFPPYVTMHSYNVNLFSGSYELAVACKDIAGNTAQKSQKFTVTLDSTPTQVLRAFKSGNNLKIITDEDSECRISDDCNFANGKAMSGLLKKEHTTPWKGNTNYNIICKDVWDNYPADCSIKVKGVNDLA